MGSQIWWQPFDSYRITRRICLCREVHCRPDPTVCGDMGMVAALPEAGGTDAPRGTRLHPDPALGRAQLDLGGESARPVLQRMVPQSLLSRRHGANICRTAETLF